MHAMTKLLQDGIEAVRALPADRQDLAGTLLLALANERLTPEQVEDLKASLAKAEEERDFELALKRRNEPEGATLEHIGKKYGLR
jgi:hypothetical protein